MIKVLSNNEILSHLYEKIFYRRTMGGKMVSSVKNGKEGGLPKINFNLSYEKNK